MADQVVITDESAVKTIEKYAEQKGVSKAEAGAKLIGTAKGRINAVRKYAAEHPRVKAVRAPRQPKGPPKAKPAKVEAQAPKRRGRPPGSKNKPKVEAAAAPAAAPVATAAI